MNIYIPSMQRSTKQITVAGLPTSVHARIHLVVPTAEADAYKQAMKNTTVSVLACPAKGIADTRQWIINTAQKRSEQKLVMMDDDLTFAKRNPDDKTKFLTCTDKDKLTMLKAVEKLVDKYTHVGVLGREGGNRITEDVALCTRMMRLYAFNLPKLKASGAKYTSGLVMDDFDMILQLLRKGHPNAVLCSYVQNQPGSNTAGGASTYRTPAVTKATVEALERIHAPFVKVVEKTTKSSWGGGTRLDVLVQWKKAYASSGGKL